MLLKSWGQQAATAHCSPLLLCPLTEGFSVHGRDFTIPLEACSQVYAQRNCWETSLGNCLSTGTESKDSFRTTFKFQRPAFRSPHQIPHVCNKRLAVKPGPTTATRPASCSLWARACLLSPFSTVTVTELDRRRSLPQACHSGQEQSTETKALQPQAALGGVRLQGACFAAASPEGTT